MLIEVTGLQASRSIQGRNGRLYFAACVERAVASVCCHGTNTEIDEADSRMRYGFAARGNACYSEPHSPAYPKADLRMSVYLTDEEQNELDALLQRVADRARRHLTG